MGQERGVHPIWTGCQPAQVPVHPTCIAMNFAQKSQKESDARNLSLRHVLEEETLHIEDSMSMTYMNGSVIEGSFRQRAKPHLRLLPQLQQDHPSSRPAPAWKLPSRKLWYALCDSCRKLRPVQTRLWRGSQVRHSGKPPLSPSEWLTEALLVFSSLEIARA